MWDSLPIFKEELQNTILGTFFRQKDIVRGN